MKTPTYLSIIILLLGLGIVYGENFKDVIESQIYGDMMYGTDDYFGNNSDISTVDRINPSKQVLQPLPVTTSSDNKLDNALPANNQPIINVDKTLPINNQPIITPDPEPPTPPSDDPY